VRTTMSPPETSADGSVVGSGVGTDDLSHWEKILAPFIAPLLTPTSILDRQIQTQWVVAHHVHHTTA